MTFRSARGDTTQMNIEQRQKIVFILSLFSMNRLDPMQDPDLSDVIVSESYNLLK